MRQENIINKERLDWLSDHEILIFDLILKNWTYRQIAMYLMISPKTVSCHLNKIYMKFNIVPRKRYKLREIWYQTIKPKKMDRILFK